MLTINDIYPGAFFLRFGVPRICVELKPDHFVMIDPLTKKIALGSGSLPHGIPRRELALTGFQQDYTSINFEEWIRDNPNYRHTLGFESPASTVEPLVSSNSRMRDYCNWDTSTR